MILGGTFMQSNKLFKGAIAGAAGVALLAGGFGSFALWSDQEALPGGTIETGHLTLAAGAEEWVDQNPADPAETGWQPGVDTMVPGDTVTLSVPLTVSAVGKNLEGTIHIDRTLLDTASFGPNFSVAYDIVPTPELGVASAGDGSVSFVRHLMGDDTINAVGTVTFALASDASLAEAQDATAQLDNAKFVITQVRTIPEP
jgi:alternate signal-mediated exported protein